MKEPLDPGRLPGNSLFFTCSSHEDRCLGIVGRLGTWRPKTAVVFHYDEPNPRRELNHTALTDALRPLTDVFEVPFAESDAVRSFQERRSILLGSITHHGSMPVVIDISVFTKRHLLMLLRWLDDYGCWDRLWIVYSEPEEYEIEGHLPLSFGVGRVEQVPGFSASPDPSRPLHVAMFLGYEGDRSIATYELLQPKQTTLIVPNPPFRPRWKGRTEHLNQNLLSVVGPATLFAHSLDPVSSLDVLVQTFGRTTDRSEFARVICPLGTKPQVVGAYLYLREAVDPPAVIYTGALRHNHSYYSRGVGPSWLIHSPS